MRLDLDDRDAVFSSCERYRYRLRRTWDRSRPGVLFVMLNPSTADADVDDPTIIRCMGFARDLGFGELLVGNLYAFRATDPAALVAERNSIGEGNDEHLRTMIHSSSMTIAAWGAHSMASKLDAGATELLTEERPLMCLGRTRLGGYPRHPVRLAATTRLEWYSAARPGVWCGGDEI